jgi:hypothetical protein
MPGVLFLAVAVAMVAITLAVKNFVVVSSSSGDRGRGLVDISRLAVELTAKGLMP